MLPVTAQVMMTLRRVTMACSSIGFGLLTLVCAQCQQTAIAPVGARFALWCRERCAERGSDLRGAMALPHARPRRIGRDTAIEAAVTLAVVGHAARRVQLDRFERAHERPAQAETLAHRLV